MDWDWDLDLSMLMDVMLVLILAHVLGLPEFSLEDTLIPRPLDIDLLRALD